jgi:hypothetical protein
VSTGGTPAVATLPAADFGTIGDPSDGILASIPAFSIDSIVPLTPFGGQGWLVENGTDTANVVPEFGQLPVECLVGTSFTTITGIVRTTLPGATAISPRGTGDLDGSNPVCIA